MARKPPKRQAKPKQSSEAKKKKVMSIILVFLMIISLAGIFLSSTNGTGNTSFEYEGYDFELVQEPSTGSFYFITEVDDRDIPFYTLPQDASNIPVEGSLASLLSQAEVVTITTDGNATEAALFDEIRFGLEVYGGIPNQAATLGPINGSSLPVLSCANATPQQPVIEVLIGGSTSEIITTNYGCAQVIIRPIDTALFRDRMLYSALGILG